MPSGFKQGSTMRLRTISIFISCTTLLALFLAVPLQAQKRDPKNINRAADNYFNTKQYYKATTYYQESIKIEPDNLHANYYLALCYQNLFDFTAAEVYFEKVKNLDLNKYPLSLYYFALMQKLNGDYDNAILNFGAFISFYDKQETDGVGISKYENYREQAKIEKEGCLIALNQLSQPFKQHNFTVEQAPLSSEYNDYAPAVFNNDSSIVLTSGRGGKGRRALNNTFGEAFTDHFRYNKRVKTGRWPASEIILKLSIPSGAMG